MKNEKTMEQIKLEANIRVQRIDLLSTIYETVYNSMKWDCMWTSEKDEEGNTIYKVPEDPSKYSDEVSIRFSDFDKYKVYQEVLKAIMDLA